MTQDELTAKITPAIDKLANAYILCTVAMDMTDDAVIAMSKLGIHRQEFKQAMNVLENAFTSYCRCYQRHLSKYPGSGDVVFRETEAMKEKVKALFA